MMMMIDRTSVTVTSKPIITPAPRLLSVLFCPQMNRVFPERKLPALHDDDDARSFYHPPTHLTSVPQRVVRVLCVRRRWRNRRDDGRQRVVVDERALQQPRQEVLAQRKVPAKQMVTSE